MHVSALLLSSPEAGLKAEFRFDWALVFVTCAGLLLLFLLFCGKAIRRRDQSGSASGP